MGGSPKIIIKNNLLPLYCYSILYAFFPVKHKGEFHVPFFFLPIIVFLSFLELDRFDYSELLYGKELNKKWKLSSFTHPHVVAYPYDFHSYVTQKTLFCGIYFFLSLFNTVEVNEGCWAPKCKEAWKNQASIQLMNNYRGNKWPNAIPKLIFHHLNLIITNGFSILAT